jgi:hypothetical protein
MDLNTVYNVFYAYASKSDDIDLKLRMNILPKKIRIDSTFNEMLELVILHKEYNVKGFYNYEGYDVFYFKKAGQVMIFNNKCYSMHTGKIV